MVDQSTEDWYTNLYQMTDEELGIVRLARWRGDGLVLWCGGEIVWKSWKEQHPKEDAYRVLAETAAVLCAAIEQSDGWVGGYALSDLVMRSLRETRDALAQLNYAREIDRT